MNFLIQFIVSIVLTLAATLLQQAFSSRPEEQQRRTGTRGSAQIGGKVPQYFLVGTVADAGKREYRQAWGSSGGVPNAYVVDVHSFGDLPITAMIGLFVNGVRVSIPATGLVSQGYPVPNYNDGADHLWRKFYDGNQITADSYLVDKFGADADRPWLSDMIGRGVPYLITTALWSETLWTGFPSFVGEFQGIPLYDPRQDTTAGGSGSQRWDNPSTWAFSDNNAVIIYNIERGIYYNTPGATTLGTRVWGGTATAAQLPYAVWAAAMNACDENVTLVAGGTEKRFRAGRKISLNERPADVIKELLISANARISHASDGQIYILVGVPSVADAAFSDDDVLATEPVGSIPYPNLDSIINGATATYREPTQAWEDKETAPYLRSDLETEDDSRQQIQGLDLGVVFSGTQAQRILKAVIEEGRRFKRHVVALPPEFAQYRPLQVLSWTSTRFDYSSKLFLITARTRSPWGQVIFGLQEIDPADHDWTPATDERSLSFAPVVVNRPPSQPITGFAVEPYTGVDASGDARRPGFRIFGYAAGLVDVEAVWVQARLSGTSGLIIDGRAPYDKAAVSPSAAWAGDPLLPATAYEVRGKLVTPSGRNTDWSSWLAVTTPDVRLSYADLDATLQNMQSHFGVQIRELTEAVQLATALGERQDASNFRDRLSLIDRMVLGDDEVSAAYVRAILLALGNNGTSIADAIEAVEAASGDVQAGVLVRFTAMASPGGGWARWGVQVRSSVDDDWGEASLYLEAKSDGSSRIVLKGGETNILDNSNNVLAAFGSDGALTYARLPNINTDKIVAGAVTSSLLSDLAVIESKLAGSAVTAGKIADAAIIASKIAAGAIVAGKISAGAIDTASLIVDGILVTSKYFSNSIIVAGFSSRTDDFGLSTSPAQMLGVTITTDGGKVVVTATVGASATSDQLLWMGIYKNGVQQIAEGVITVLAGKSGGGTLVWVDTSPGSGSNTYAVYAWESVGDLDHIYSGITVENHKNA